MNCTVWLYWMGFLSRSALRASCCVCKIVVLPESDVNNVKWSKCSALNFTTWCSIGQLETRKVRQGREGLGGYAAAWRNPTFTKKLLWNDLCSIVTSFRLRNIIHANLIQFGINFSDHLASVHVRATLLHVHRQQHTRVDIHKAPVLRKKIMKRCRRATNESSLLSIPNGALRTREVLSQNEISSSVEKGAWQVFPVTCQNFDGCDSPDVIREVTPDESTNNALLDIAARTGRYEKGSCLDRGGRARWKLNVNLNVRVNEN